MARDDSRSCSGAVTLCILFQMLSQSDEKAFTKSLRILGFQMKVLTALVRDYHDYLSDSVPGIHKLLLYLNRCVFPFLCLACQSSLSHGSKCCWI